MAENKYQGLRGMNDLLPGQTERWQELEAIIRRWLNIYGYGEIRTPILEQTALFSRSIGAVTDIVEKEMYSFLDQLNGESLTLRPEGTASCVRMVLEHHLLYSGPKRLWYQGPMFRHERPQKGRYRQFHQCGVEALGFSDPMVDVELIVMTHRLWQELKLQDVCLELNTIGDAACRARYRVRLIEYLERNKAQLDADSQRRLYTNPLRILDSKNFAMQELLAEAPQLIDDLSDEVNVHFEQVKKAVEALGISFNLNARLVRGLDYYNRTVFEWTSPALGAQATICGGGRYDGLVEQLGGKPTPACGFAMGLERLLDVIEAQSSWEWREQLPLFYMVYEANTALLAFEWAERLRSEGVSVVYHGGVASLKSQFKRADGSGALYALVVGEKEQKQQQVTVKSLRTQIEQVSLSINQVLEWIKQDFSHV